jgi:hypothetical protein
MLERALDDARLDQDITSPREVLNILERSTGMALGTYWVSRMVNKPSVDGHE